MIVFIPAFILLGAAIAVIVLQFIPRGTGFAWFASVFFSIAAWIVTILLHARLPLMFSGQYWITIGFENQIPAFQMDIITWPFALIISSLVAGVLLVSSIRIGLDSNPEEWASILLVGALGYLGVISTNILTVMLILGSIDLVEITILIFSSKDQNNLNFEIRSILWRLAGLTLFMAAYGWQVSLAGTADDWRTLQSGPVHLMLFSCAIRLGIFPIPALIGSPRLNQNGFLVVRNIVITLAASAIILQLPFFEFSPILKNVILSYLLLTAIASSIRVARNGNSEDLLAGWQVAAGSLICAVFVMGFSYAGISLSISISVLAAILMLSFPINIFSKLLGFLAIAGFSGLPLTPNVSGFAGFGLASDFPGVLFLIPVVVLLYSAIQIVLKKTMIENENTEQWTRILSPIGLIFPIVSTWVIFLNGITSKDVFKISIPAIIAVFICAAILVNSKFKIFDFNGILNKGIHEISKRTTSNSKVFQIFRESIKGPYQSPLILLTNLFEGEGGVLWSVLSLVLIITIIRTLGFTQ